MDAKVPPNPDLNDVLAELASLGMRASRVATRLMEIEQQVADIVAADLPKPGFQPQSITEAEQAGRDIDSATDIMAKAVPHFAILSRALDRSSRGVRFAVALIRRIEAGWPRAGSADNRQAMLRRQVARGVADVIRRESDGEAAERLFDDLSRLLHDPALEEEIGVLPEAEVVRRICHLLGLGGLQATRSPQPPSPKDGWPIDSS